MFEFECRVCGEVIETDDEDMAVTQICDGHDLYGAY